MLSSVFGVVVFVFWSVSHVAGNPSQRVVGGQESLPGVWSGVVALKFTDYATNKSVVGCTGTIVSPRHVLTSAHCFVMSQSSGNGKFVTIDAYVEVDVLQLNRTFSPDRRLPSSTRIFIHNKYNPLNNRNDLAIFELQEDFDCDIKPVLLANVFKERFDQRAIELGYGKYDVKGDDDYQLVHTEQLRQVAVNIMAPTKCRKNYAQINVLVDPEIHVCAGEFDKGSSKGDSGGPLMALIHGEFVQVGIDSFKSRDFPRELDVLPGVFTRVTKYCSWIKKVTNGAAVCGKVIDNKTSCNNATTKATDA